MANQLEGVVTGDEVMKADGGYNNFSYGYHDTIDKTTVKGIVGTGIVSILHKSTAAVVLITLASWKLKSYVERAY